MCIEICCVWHHIHNMHWRIVLKHWFIVSGGWVLMHRCHSIPSEIYIDDCQQYEWIYRRLIKWNDIFRDWRPPGRQLGKISPDLINSENITQHVDQHRCIFLIDSAKLFDWMLSLNGLDSQRESIGWSLKSQCTQCVSCTICDQLTAPLRIRFCWFDFYNSRASAGLFMEPAKCKCFIFKQRSGRSPFWHQEKFLEVAKRMMNIFKIFQPLLRYRSLHPFTTKLQFVS